ncbi:MAG: sodium:solute symporter family protein [Vicinamibacteria bacterium]|jgi:SSS family solute:Na+ symporter|nr:sodium:solute symporter family protein [Vicinamibacteria bacterium]MBP9947432.1 sodium:solute symporter family protein [Vicinamibacteria bacterium]
MIYLILVYCVLQVALGLWLGRKVRSSGDFFVAGRSLSPGLLFATLVAANVGAGSTVGAAGLGYSNGISAWWWVGSAGVGSLIMAFTVGPRIWKIASDHGLKTAGDFLEWRFSRNLRGAVSSLLWVGTISILSGQLIALAWVLNVVAGLDKTTGVIIGGVVATIYFSAGGLLSSVWINFLQLGVMIVGFFAAIPLALSKAGGFSGLQAATSDPAGFWNFFSNGTSGIHYLALLAPAFVISPGLIQKVYGARDAATVRKAVAWNAGALFIFAFVPPMIGLLARALHPGLASPELAMPTIFMEDLPVWFGALGLAAVVSAEISTADAVLFMLSTSLSQDLYKGFVNRNATDQEVLRVARLAAVGGGILGILVALMASTVIGALGIFYSLLSVSLFVPVVLGLYVSSADSRNAYAAIVAGVGVLLTAHLTTDGKGFGMWTPSLLGLLASAAAGGLSLLVFRRSLPETSNPKI